LCHCCLQNLENRESDIWFRNQANVPAKSPPPSSKKATSGRRRPSERGGRSAERRVTAAGSG
jgi:hypothetical protein